MIIVPALICVKFKIEITLFLRDTLGCHRSSPGTELLLCLQFSAKRIMKRPHGFWSQLLFPVTIVLDGKSYDAFLMCYQADAAAAVNEPDRRWIANVLEEKFGYSLCLDDRDALPGKGECFRSLPKESSSARSEPSDLSLQLWPRPCWSA